MLNNVFKCYFSILVKCDHSKCKSLDVNIYYDICDMEYRMENPLNNWEYKLTLY